MQVGCAPRPPFAQAPHHSAAEPSSIGYIFSRGGPWPGSRGSKPSNSSASSATCPVPSSSETQANALPHREGGGRHLVDLDAEAGLGDLLDGDVAAVVNAEGRHKHPVAHRRLLLHKKVRNHGLPHRTAQIISGRLKRRQREAAAHVEMERGAEGDRAEGAVRRHGDRLGLRHRRDLAALPDAAGLDEVGLHDLNGPRRDHVLELPARVQACPQQRYR